MKKLLEIYNGWKNHLFGSKDETFEKTFEKRMTICKQCPENSINKNEKYFLRIDEHCTLCGCTLSAKTKSPESECPIGKWKTIKQNI